MTKLLPWMRIALFYLLAFVLTGIFSVLQGAWGIPGELAQLPQIGPALAALLFIAFERNSVRVFLKEGLSFRLDKSTVLLTLIPVFLIPTISILTTSLWGAQNFNKNISIAFVFSTIVAALCEEIGWRGYMLSRLQARMSTVKSSLILGVLWGLWHVPKLLMGAEFFVVWFMGIMGITFVLTYAFNRSGGNILAVTLIHSSVNLMTYFFLLGFTDPKVNLTNSAFYVLWAVALALGGGFSSRTQKKPELAAQY